MNTYNIDYGRISTALSEIPRAIINRIEREQMKELQALHLGLPSMLKLTLKVNEITWQSIKFLCSDVQELPSRKEEFAITIPPLSRTVLDSLITIIFIFDQPKINSRWYIASGWKEAKNHHQLLFAKYGVDPVWKDWFRGNQEWIDSWNDCITDDERTNPDKIKWCPHPGILSSDRCKSLFIDKNRHKFLTFLNEWHYSHLSGDSHLSMMGLSRRGGLLLDREDHEAKKQNLLQYRFNVVLNGLIIYISLLSEVVGQLKLNHESRRLRDVWTYIGDLSDAKDLYALRYDKWLL